MGSTPAEQAQKEGSSRAVRRKEIRRAAREGLGYDHLRPGQQAVIESVLGGHDTLAVMPTGSGKSAIYQIAGALIPGTTVVVSPLLALQADQLNALEDQEIGDAVAVNSTVPEGERQETLETLEEERYEFVFLAPEQFKNPEVIESLRHSAPSLFVVDEAHCISEWGHDFRPDYLLLGGIIESLGHPTVLALTATAAPPVRKEIIERLDMRDPRVVVRGFDRPNIWLGVEMFGDETGKRRGLVERIKAEKKPGIVYAATRKTSDELAALLRDAGVVADSYHAGMRTKERENVYDALMSDEIEVIVATIAFGMGVDKPNVRFVYHFDISESVDAYTQEMGRAGRDGEPARAILFYSPGDLGLRRFFASSGVLEPEQVRHVIDALSTDAESGTSPVTLAQLQEQVDLSTSKLTAILARLEEVGAVRGVNAGAPGGRWELAHAADLDLDRVVDETVEAQERRRQYDRTRVDMIRGYAELTSCRRQYLLGYFGEELTEACGYCDNCDARQASRGGDLAPAKAAEPFPVNSHVSHKQWGVGQVLRYEGDEVTVLFDQVGYKTLSVPVVLEHGLLSAQRSGPPGNGA